MKLRRPILEQMVESWRLARQTRNGLPSSSEPEGAPRRTHGGLDTAPPWSAGQPHAKRVETLARRR